jgi:hypothetical protein
MTKQEIWRRIDQKIERLKERQIDQKVERTIYMAQMRARPLVRKALDKAIGKLKDRRREAK